MRHKISLNVCVDDSPTEAYTWTGDHFQFQPIRERANTFNFNQSENGRPLSISTNQRTNGHFQFQPVRERAITFNFNPSENGRSLSVSTNHRTAITFTEFQPIRAADSGDVNRLWLTPVPLILGKEAKRTRELRLGLPSHIAYRRADNRRDMQVCRYDRKRYTADNAYLNRNVAGKLIFITPSIRERRHQRKH